MLLFALSVTMLVAAAAAAAAALRLEPPGFLLAVYLLGVGQVVLLTEVLSLAEAVGRVGYLAGQVPLLVLAGWAWNRTGRPGAQIVWRRPSAVEHPIVAALAVVVAAGLAYEAFLGLTVPPNNWDAMTYHLSRAAGWLQAGGVQHLDAHSERINLHPPNGEIQVLYTFAFLGRDTFAALPQLVAQLALLVAIYGMARRTGSPRGAALFACLLFATLTQVALQATSAQNDLVAAAPVAACAYFLLGGRKVELILAGAALGLAVGTKWTVLAAIPSLTVIALVALRARELRLLAAASLVSVAALGAYGYALNLVHEGTPLGSSPEHEKFEPTGGVTRLATALRITYDFADLSGLHAPAKAVEAVASAGEAAFRAAGIDPNPAGATASPFVFRPNTSSDEDLSYFGPLGLLLVLPLCAVFALRLRSEPRRAALALALPLFIVGVSLGHSYDPWIGRYMTMAVALAMPLAAALYGRRVIAATAAVIGAVTLACALVFNVSKPLSRSPWSTPRAEAQAIRQPHLEPVFEWVERHVPDTTTLGIGIGSDDPDYPLYGPRLRRRLVPVDSLRDARDLRYVVASRFGDAEEPGWKTVPLTGGWRAFRRER